MTQLSSLFGGVAVGQKTKLLHIEDQKPSGTPGGTFTSGAWQTRVLNTVVTHEISGASLSTNQITLPAGNYFVDIIATAHYVNRHRTKLYSITDTSDVLLGSSEYSWASGNTTNHSDILGEFTLTSTKVLEIQHQCGSTKTTSGYGLASSYGTEIYVDVKIWKLS